MAIILELSVTFTLKELSSSFYIISDFERAGIVFSQKEVVFEMKKKNESKGKHWVPELFH